MKCQKWAGQLTTGVPPLLSRREPTNPGATASTSGGADDAGGSKKAAKPPAKAKKLSKAQEERQRLEAYRVPPQLGPGRWELIASNLTQMEEVGSRLKRSLKRPDALLSAKVGEDWGEEGGNEELIGS